MTATRSRLAVAGALASAVGAACPPTLVNPYRGPGGRNRLANLTGYMCHYAAREVRAILVLEAAGRNGSLRTGVPATNFAMATEYPFSLRPDHAAMPTKPDNTSRRIWQYAWQERQGDVLCWNAVPWNPATWSRHDRPPSAAEVGAGAPFLAQVLALYRPSVIVAVGRKAEAALASVGVSAPYVPHPAQDRAKEFALGVRGLLA